MIDELTAGKSATRTIIGLSGGVDSSYLALLSARWGLRPLVVHVDAGWNTAASVRNVRQVVDRLGLDLHTVVINWRAMRNLQRAFLYSGVRNQDIPQDHAFFSSLYRIANKYKIRNVLVGANLTTESILPSSWGKGAMDGRYIRSVARSQGVQRLDSYPLLHLSRHYMLNLGLRRMVIYKPLDMINYVRSEAIRELEQSVGWMSYGGKHRESLFTSWYQHSYLVRRFGIDKRKAHYSSLIVSGQMTRETALSKLESPTMESLEEKVVSQQVARKLGFSETELFSLVALPEINESEFANDEWINSASLLKVGKNLVSSRNQILRNS